ncbi:hypothetical protein L600_002800000260 [Isoptericola variabilis J7]|nr:hypothetical protein L600_002800000260 [Isoptericola variabilis J7]
MVGAIRIPDTVGSMVVTADLHARTPRRTEWLPTRAVFSAPT